MGYLIKEAIEKISGQIKNAKKIALQLPDGLKIKTKINEILSELKKYTNAEILFLEGSNFGACDLRDKEAKNLGADLLLHFGHSDFGLKTEIKTVYVEIQSDLDIDKVVQKAANEIKENKIGVITTLQHIEQLNKIKEILEKNGKKVFTAKPTGNAKYEAQILGCDSSAGTILKDKVDCFLYVGTGNFHPLPVAIETALRSASSISRSAREDKKVYVADPELNQLRELTEFKNKILKQIAEKNENAKNAQKFGILVSTKKGQYRIELAEKIKEKIEKSGKKAEILVFDTIDYLELNKLKFDCYVNTACPRIALDDIEVFEKPVLNQNELEIVLGIRKKGDYKLGHSKGL